MIRYAWVWISIWHPRVRRIMSISFEREPYLRVEKIAVALEKPSRMRMMS